MKETVKEATVQKMVNEELADNQKWVDDFKGKHGRFPNRSEFFAHRKAQFERGETLVGPEDFMKILDDMGVEWS